MNLFIGDMYDIYMSSTTLHAFDLEALNSRPSMECQSTPRNGLKKCLDLPYYWS